MVVRGEFQMSGMMVMDHPPLEPPSAHCRAGSLWRLRVDKKILISQEVVLVVVVPIGSCRNEAPDLES